MLLSKVLFCHSKLILKRFIAVQIFVLRDFKQTSTNTLLALFLLFCSFFHIAHRFLILLFFAFLNVFLALKGCWSLRNTIQGSLAYIVPFALFIFLSYFYSVCFSLLILKRFIQFGYLHLVQSSTFVLSFVLSLFLSLFPSFFLFISFSLSPSLPSYHYPSILHSPKFPLASSQLSSKLIAHSKALHTLRRVTSRQISNEPIDFIASHNWAPALTL